MSDPNTLGDPRIDKNTDGPLNRRTPLRDDFPSVAKMAFREAGYAYLEDFTRATAPDLLKIHGVGPKAIRILRDILHTQGLSLAGE